MIIEIPVRSNVPKTELFVRITYKNEESLKTKPYVLMLPGGPGANHSHYRDYKCLKEDANIIFFDPRGCGLSQEGDPSTYTMDITIDDIHHVLQELKLEQVTVLGKSCGAMHALGFALRYPHQVSRLILAAGAASNAFLETAKAHVLAKGTEEQIKACELLWQGAFANKEEAEHYFTVMQPFYSWKKRHNEPVSRPLSIFPFSFKVLNEGFRTRVWDFDFTAQLSSVRCPTLILVGEEDWVTSVAYSQEMAQGIPDSKLMIFKNADHSMESDVPKEYFGAIRHFIKERTLEKIPVHSLFAVAKEAEEHITSYGCIL